MAGGAEPAGAAGKHDEPLLATVRTPDPGKPAARVAAVEVDKNLMLTGHETSRVTFRKLSRAAIEKSLKTNEYLDKAGGYAIQESGDVLVESLEGDYDNVVGLPVRLLSELLNDFMRI
jgi:predicted house-cleaning NTP pyrophosphatase (Maf/HAM1 superfamily)